MKIIGRLAVVLAVSWLAGCLESSDGDAIDAMGDGWVQVTADFLSPDAICDALSQGLFYSSTGVEISQIKADGDTVQIDIRPSGLHGYTTTFIGDDGRVLKREDGLAPSYSLIGDEVYVRATVARTDGKLAWIQPIFSQDSPNSNLFASDIHLNAFYKGNTHTHTKQTLASGGNITRIIEWYRSRGYNFLAITDLDIASIPGEFTAWESESFIVIAGEEVASVGITENGVSKPVHTNALCSNGTTVGGITLGGIGNALQDTIDRIIDVAQGTPQINHPNYRYALTVQEIYLARDVSLFEVANQRHHANNKGDATRVSTEETWDGLLSAGKVIYGVASDDNHVFVPENPRGVVND